MLWIGCSPENRGRLRADARWSANTHVRHDDPRPIGACRLAAVAARQPRRAGIDGTGVFWQPIYNVLEDTGLDMLLANARYIKAVPRRKALTDTVFLGEQDAQ